MWINIDASDKGLNGRVLDEDLMKPERSFFAADMNFGE